MKVTESKTVETAEGIIYTPARYERKRNALDWYVYYNEKFKMIYGSTKDYASKEDFLIKKCGKDPKDAPYLTDSVFIDKNYTGSEMRELKRTSDEI